MLKSLAIRLVFLLVLAIVAVILLVQGLERGIVSAGLFRIGSFLLPLGMGISAVLIIKRSAMQANRAAPPHRVGDEAARTRTRLAIKIGEFSVGILAALLVLRLLSSKGYPLWLILSTSGVSIFITGALISWIIKLRKSIN